VKRSPFQWAVILAAVGLVGLLVYGVTARRQDTSIDDALKQGKRIAAPTRTLPVLDSTAKNSLAGYRGKVVVLNFWASWCIPCRTEAPVLERAQRRLLANDGTVLGVNFRDAPPDANRFIARYHLTYPSLRDVDGKLAHDYGTNALPETFVIDRRGKVAGVSRGTVTDAFLRRTLGRLLPERA
jgi:cytochrome c biogenesis protein CcmG/thiol:disulfide interchange protein DsbE